MFQMAIFSSLFGVKGGDGVVINADSNSFVCSGGGMDHVEEESERNIPNFPKKNVEVAVAADDSQSRIQAARERFLARKVNK